MWQCTCRTEATMKSSHDLNSNGAAVAQLSTIVTFPAHILLVNLACSQPVSLAAMHLLMVMWLLSTLELRHD